MSTLRVGCVQLRSGLRRMENYESAAPIITEAARAGANLVVTPEMTNVVDVNPKRLMAEVVSEQRAQELTAFRQLAQSLNVWLLLGSLAIKLSERRAANRAFLVNPSGDIVARYDKLHMFDVDLAGGESYRESSVYEAGRTAVAVDTPLGRLGLSICYDLRFPHLYRALAQAGATVLFVPSAFTRQTGERHWHTLLRARAIENGAFVVAAAQGGKHEDGRETYGHSLVASPSGKVLVDKGDAEPGFIVADLDLKESQLARASIPNLNLDCEFETVTIQADLG